MKAVVHQGTAGLSGLYFTDIAEREPGAKEVKIRLRSAGLNHRDLFVLDRHEEMDPPVVIGSDGAGVIDSVGEKVTGVELGEEVIINPGLGWDEKSDAPPSGFEILGYPGHGTFAESVIVPSKNVAPKPAHLSWEEAGVLSLGALTAYRALFSRGKLGPAQTVLLPGIGSGVVTFLLKMAKTLGARVIVTSRSEAKRKRALELGADIAVDSDKNWGEFLQNETVDLVIESVGAATFEKSLSMLRPGGTIVVFGASAGDETTINLRTFFYGQYNMLGSTMGSNEEFRKMLEFIEKYQLTPVLDQTFPLEKTKEALKRLDDANQLGKIAVTMGNSSLL